MDGCLSCATINYCTECNKSAGYYLAGKICVKSVPESNIIYSQGQTGIRLQLNTSINTTEFSELIRASGLLKRVYDQTSANQTLIDDVPIKLLASSLGSNGILSLIFDNPDTEHNNTMISVVFVVAKRVPSPNPPTRLLALSNGTDEKGPYIANEENLYIYRDRIRTSAMLNVSNGWYYQLEMALVALVLLVSMAVYVRGEKHNQTVFFLQTLAFISFVLKDDYYSLSIILYNLKFSYYSFSNALSMLIPSGYLETSQGNFDYLTTDSNFLKVAGTPAAIAAVNLVLIVILRIIFYSMRRAASLNPSRSTVAVSNNRKYFYRFVEFLYKTCMYPLVFFSFVTLDNWRMGVYVLTDHQTYELVCRISSAIIPFGYLAVTVWQLRSESVSKIYRLENVIEYVSVLMASMVIVLSVHTSVYVTVFVVFLLRGLAYLFIRRRYMRYFQTVEYIKGISTIF
jgi:hypothetical protein